MASEVSAATRQSGSESPNSGSLKPIASIIFAIWPLFMGLWAIWTFLSYYDPAKHGLSVWNIHSWPVMQYAPTSEFAILYMMIVSNAIVVVLGTWVYIGEIWRGFDPAESGRSYLLAALLCGIAGMAVAIAWVGGVLFYNLLASLGGNASDMSWTFLKINDWFVIGIFFCFGVADVFLFLGYRRDLQNCEKRSYPADAARGFRQKKNFALNCIFFIDVPVIVGSFVLLLIAQFELPQFGQLTPFFFGLFVHDKIKVDTLTHLSQVTLNTFVAGFILGSIICQLAYSQMVFTVLNVKLSLTTAKRSPQ
jgi:hypothetical protein